MSEYMSKVRDLALTLPPPLKRLVPEPSLFINRSKGVIFDPETCFSPARTPMEKKKTLGGEKLEKGEGFVVESLA